MGRRAARRCPTLYLIPEATLGNSPTSPNSGANCVGATASLRVALLVLLDFCEVQERELADELHALIGEQCCGGRFRQCANWCRLSHIISPTLDRWCYYGSVTWGLKRATQIAEDAGGTSYDMSD